MTFNKVLVVDDARVVQVKLSRMLTARGLSADAVGSGREALAYLESHAPDVILMDYMMPDLDGYQVTRMITANPRTSRIPVIMCTGQDTPEDRARAHESGASGFLTKPVEDAALDALLATARQKAAAPKQVAPAVPVAAAAEAPAPAPAPTENMAQIVERAARDAAQAVVREAMAALSENTTQAARQAAQAVATSILRDAMANWRAEEAKTHERTERTAVAAAERVAQSMTQQALDAAKATRQDDEAEEARLLESARQAGREAAEAQLPGHLEAVRTASEETVREALASAQAKIDEASRQALLSARPALQDLARETAQAAALRAVRDARAAEKGGEDAARNQVQQLARAVAEQVARETLQKALAEAAESGRQAAAQQVDGAMQSIRVQVDEEVQRAVESAREILAESAHPEPHAADAGAVEQQPARPTAPPSALADKVLLPWLAALTLGMLYLLVRSFA